MYIPEFICGAVAVVGLEIVALVIASLVRARRK
jgi:hypothetical protein